MLIVDSHQLSPFLCAIQIEGEYARRILGKDILKPILDGLSLEEVAPLSKCFDAAANLTDDLNGEKQCLLCAEEEVQDVGIRSGSLACLT